MIGLDPKKALEEQLKALELAYISSFPAKKRAIRQAWQRLNQGQYNPAVAKELFKLTHKLAGSGGLYGFSRLTDIARKIERLLCTVIADNQFFPDAGIRLEPLIRQLEEVLDEFSAT